MTCVLSYIFGPRSDENSQWKMSTCRLSSNTGVVRRVLTSSFVYKLTAPRMCPPSNSYGYRQSTMVTSLRTSLKCPRTTSAITSGEIDFKSRCFPAIVGNVQSRDPSAMTPLPASNVSTAVWMSDDSFASEVNSHPLLAPVSITQSRSFLTTWTGDASTSTSAQRFPQNRLRLTSNASRRGISGLVGMES